MKHFYTFLLVLFLSVNVNAQCVFSMPFTENFDGSTWVIPPNATQAGSISACWTRTPNAVDRYYWVPGPSIPAYTFSGPVSDHTTGSGKFIFSGSGTGTGFPPFSATIETPFISLVGATSPEISFWYHMFGAQMGSLNVLVSNGGAWVNLNTTSGQQQSSNTAAWLKKTISLSAYVGDTIRIRFEATKATAAFNTRIAIDDVSIAEAPTCTPPTNLYSSATTTTSTTIGWFAGATASTSWEVEHGPSGFTLGNGTLTTVTTNPTTITGLSGSSTYAFYVREVCSPTDKSPWVGPIYVTTPCSGPMSLPYYENFDNPSWETFVSTQNFGAYASCWVGNPALATFNYMWLVNPNNLFSNNTGPNGDHTTGTGKYVAAQSIAGSNTVAILRSPQIDLSTVNFPELNFWYHMFGANITSLEVDIKPVVGGSWTNLYTKTGQQQTSSSALWQSASVSLAAYGTQTVYIRFKATRNSSSGQSAKIAIDDLSIIPGSSCPKPAGFIASNISSNSVDLVWTGTGAHELKRGPIGFNPSLTGTSTLVTGNSNTQAGLMQNTTYQFYVRKFCTNDTSNWEGPLTITTLCIATAPYNQNFDGVSWVPPVNFSNDNGSISNCWNRSQVQTFVWTPGPPPFASFGTGPSADHTTGTATGKYMFTDSPNFGGTAPISATLITEQIDLSPLDTPELSFWYHMFGNQIGTLKVEVSNGGPWTQIFTKTGQQQTSKTDDWDEATINLVNYVNDTIRLRFTGSKAVNGFNSEIAIDDVDIHELPSCPKPTNFTAGVATFNSVLLNWTTGGASNWIFKYGAPGFITGSYASAATNPFTLPGLSPNTDYEVWVRDSCGLGDVSQWVGPVYFRTACSPTIAPYIESFNGTTFVPWTFVLQEGEIDDCYRRSAIDEYFWVPGPGQFSSNFTGPSSAFGGSGKYMYTRTNNFQASLQTSFTTPWINIGSLTAPELRFYYHMFGNSIDKLEVRAQNYDGTFQFLTVLNGQQQTSGAAAWVQKVQSLAGVTSDTIRIVFTGYRVANGFNAELAIDEVEVSNPQNCTAPTALTTSNITTTSVQLSWTSGASAAGTNIEYGPTGFTPGGGGTMIYGVTSPFVVTNLLGNTSYQFYIQDSCTWGGLSTPVGPVSATTLPCPAVTASFTSTVAGLTVTFNGSASLGNPTSFDWDFGDGNTATGNPVNHTYATGGIYNVTLIATNACGSIDTVIISSSTCLPVASLFTFTASGLTLNFDGNISSGTSLSYDWDFGDGTTGTGLTTNHTYAIDGNYVITLIVTDICGGADTSTQSIDVCSPAIAVLNYTQNGLDVNFDASSSTGAVQFQWFFGDGAQSTSAAIVHTYASTGTYQVTLYTTNLCGDRDTVIITLTLCNTPKAAWTYTILSSNASGMNVQFDGTASIGANSFKWEFGDGAVNTTSAIPTHMYSVPGLFYVVKLTVTNDCGDDDVFSSSLASIGIKDFEKAGLKIFPNPVDDFLSIQTPDFLELTSLHIFSSIGQEITVDKSIESNKIKVNTSQIESGSYILRIKTNAGEAVYQFVVSH